LVHDSVRDDRIEAARHLQFITWRLLLSLAALVAMPVYLAVQGAPGLVDMFAFLLAMTPLAAAFLVSRTGNRMLGHRLCVVAMLGLAMTLAAGSGASSPAAMVWLALAPVEAYLAGSAALVALAGAASILVAVAVLAASLAGLLSGVAPLSDPASTMLVALAVAYATVLGLGALRVDVLNSETAVRRRLRYDTLSEAIGEPVLWLDRTGAVRFASPETQARFRLAPQELIGRGLFDRIHVADRPAYLKTIADARDRSEACVATVRVRIPDPDANERAQGQGRGQGVYFAWIELRARQMRRMQIRAPAQAAGPDGSASDEPGVIAILRDVSADREHERVLAQARQEAERASVWKDRFIANVSHELRTPLNAIIGFSEILADNKLSPADPAKRQEYARIIKESGEHLLSVVNSILDISKIEAGSFDICPEEFDVEPLIDDCLDMLRLRAQSGSVTLRKSFPAGFGELVADKRAFKQIVINLLSNAIKFTPSGGVVTVSMRHEGASALLRVSDTGIGIFENELSRIGDPFFQASDNYDRAYEGTGLGLSVVRGLVGLHGGAIRIESAPGSGTCVTVKLPRDSREASANACALARIETIPLQPAPVIDASPRPEEIRQIA